MSNWGHGGRTYRGFPTSVVAQAHRVLPYHCATCGRDDTTLELDHINNNAEGGTDTIDNAQWLCPRCHSEKTRAEAIRGRARRAARGRRPAEKHPGLL
ncbi:HNH endonuclease [Gordonia sp. (in: high G+C Gram-positive bacteria)]|uniref:HNH endonuclease n=1 Tax=Gordonia sp. (in: high G+C Gram-positive bacteria) TaxID=84139 RepID=UPI003F9887F9